MKTDSLKINKDHFTCYSNQPDVIQGTLQCQGANQSGWKWVQVTDMDLHCVAMVTPSDLVSFSKETETII